MKDRSSAAYWGITLVFAILGGLVMGWQSNLFVGSLPDSRQQVINTLVMVPLAIPAFLFASAVTRRHLFRPNLILSAILYFETVVLAVGLLLAAMAAVGNGSLLEPSIWLLPIVVIGIAHVKAYLFLPVAIAFVWTLRRFVVRQEG